MDITDWNNDGKKDLVVGKYINGEIWPANVQTSGNADALQLWSADGTFEGSANHTSVGLS